MNCTQNSACRPRHLVLVLGDQLNRGAAAFDDFDADRDAVWMAEVEEEITHVWCHRLRIAFFLSAMRHFRDELIADGVKVHYTALTQDPLADRGADHASVMAVDVHALRPLKLIVTQPGDYRVLEMLRGAARNLNIEMEVREDRRFYARLDEFDTWAEGRNSLLMEAFYRRMRSDHGILLEPDGKPLGGKWNYDHANRESFKKAGPVKGKPPRGFKRDALTNDVLALVQARFAAHPGSLDHLDLPVTRDQARLLLRDFIRHRLADFGAYQDAMWGDETFLNHSRLSAALNLKLLDPRECVDAAIKAYNDGDAPLNSVEGFVRQLLGWREFVRGVYWRHMPDYAAHNALDCDADRDVPTFYWDGETDMRCMSHALRAVIDHAYTHHIHRLMVLGLFAQLSGVHPRRFHDWHMAMYLDAIDWVSLPNALGMSQYGDGGLVGTKPYCASGNYINRMSNYCGDCRYDYRQASGERACPFTTFYWDFLDRHRHRFQHNARLKFQMKNLERKSDSQLNAIRARARQLVTRIASGERI